MQSPWQFGGDSLEISDQKSHQEKAAVKKQLI
jgi:hypothetical protein